MKAEIVAKIAVWFIIFVALLTLGLGMMSTPNSVENVLGFLLCVPCCSKCNYMKGTLQKREFLSHVGKIYNFLINKGSTT